MQIKLQDIQSTLNFKVKDKCLDLLSKNREDLRLTITKLTAVFLTSSSPTLVFDSAIP